jgi:integrase
MANSTKSRKSSNVLRVHTGSGQWAKKIKGKLIYFGSVKQDPEGVVALQRYAHELPYWKRGEVPPTRGAVVNPAVASITLRELCNQFLSVQEDRQTVGELSPRSFRDYYRACERLIDHFGRGQVVTDLRPQQFTDYRLKVIAKTKDGEDASPASIKGAVILVRAIFKFAAKLVGQPIDLGDYFKPPKKTHFRRHRAAVGSRDFTADEVRRILGAADVQLKAMTLLALNCGYGNSDCAELTKSAIKGDWVEFARVKTGIERRCPLWPETVEAVKAAIASRPNVDDSAHSDRIFITRCGVPWVRTQPKKRKTKTTADETAGVPMAIVDSISCEFRKLLDRLGINGSRNFYALRHTLQTQADESRDFIAVRKIMGHASNDIADAYRERVSDERLKAVVQVVHDWLFAPAKAEGGVK